MTFPKKQKGINKDNLVLVYLINLTEVFKLRTAGYGETNRRFLKSFVIRNDIQFSAYVP
jgi:hypothetical protein